MRPQQNLLCEQGRRVATHMAEEADEAALENRIELYVGTVDSSVVTRRKFIDSKCVCGTQQGTIPASDLHSQLAAVLAELAHLKLAISGLTSNVALITVSED